MRKSVSMFLIVCMLLIVFPVNGTPTTVTAETEATVQVMEPIVVNSNALFPTVGFTGNGTENDPYILDGVTIETDIENYGINISYTTAFFIIKNVEINGYISLTGVKYGRITESQVQHIYLEYSDYNSIDNNRIENAALKVCIRLRDSNRNNITRNTCSKGTWGIDVNGNKNIIVENECLSMGTYMGIGIILNVGFNNTVISNVLTLNPVGLRLWYSEYSYIFNNSIIGNTNNGVTIEHSQKNVFTENIVSNNDGNGIILYSGTENCFQYNTIEINDGYGINMKINASNNQIDYNAFSGNCLDESYPSEKQGFDEGQNNIFEYNYWSNWLYHPDSESDGVIDVPYPIDGGANTDPYPLTKKPEKPLSETATPTNTDGFTVIMILGIFTVVILRKRY